MLERLGSLSAARPRRTLILLLSFVVLAGVVGGPVAGQLESEDGFTADSSESSRADDQIQRASGQGAAPGIILLVDGSAARVEQRAQAAADELSGLPGVAGAAPAGLSEDGESAIVSGSARAGADEEDVADAALTAFADSPNVTVGGSAVAGLQLSETVSEDLGRAELFAFPLLLLSLLFFRGRAAGLARSFGVIRKIISTVNLVPSGGEVKGACG